MGRHSEHATQKETPPHKARGDEKSATSHITPSSTRTGNSAAAQRVRLLTALRHGPVSTIDARRPPLDVMHPAQRVLELRAAGFNVLTAWSHEPTDAGKLHRVAKYVLVGGCQ